MCLSLWVGTLGVLIKSMPLSAAHLTSFVTDQIDVDSRTNTFLEY
jgi:hypothetical protein